MATMSLDQFYALEQTDKTQKRGLGDGLYGLILPKNKKSNSSPKTGKYFYWKNAKYEIRIGACKKFTEKQARKKVLEFQDCVRQGKNPKSLGIPTAKETKTFKNAADAWFNSPEVQILITPITRQNYKNQLYRQALPFIGKDTLLKDLQWSDETNGREILMNMFDTLRIGRTGEQARKVLGVCRQVFNYAIERDWMSKNSNPALTPHKLKLVKKHHPTITWTEVPQLFEDFERNEPNGLYENLMVLKMLTMTGLRISTVVRFQWSWIKEVEGINCIVIPSGTKGLKDPRFEVINGNGQDHLVPITDQIQSLLDEIRPKTFHTDYVFASPRSGKYPHICEDAPNRLLNRLGYKDRLTAHGWRQVFLTAGQEVCGFARDIIQRQMGHRNPNGDEVTKAYDRSKHLVKRKDFLEKWCNALVEQGLVVGGAN